MKRILIVLVIAAMMFSSFSPIHAQAATAASVEDNPYLIEYENQQFIVPPLSLNREPGITESGYVEKYTEPPHYFQTYYPDVKYGSSTIRRGGCGIACVSMVLTYLLDEEVSIRDLAKTYFRYHGPYGSSYSLFKDSAEDYGIEVSDPVYDWDTVKKALENGHVVIANPKSPSIFTDGGHYIVLSGLTEDGKIVVRDPNLYNYGIWNYAVREEGYANGFSDESLKYYCFPCWIYEKKDLETVAARAELEETADNSAESQENP